MKNVVEFEPSWKFEFEIQLSDAFDNLKRTNLMRAQLGTRLVDFDILSL